MKWSRVLPAVGRHAVVALGVAALLTTGMSVLAQEPAAAAPPPQEADPLKFNLEIPVLIVSFIKADKIADYEAGWALIRSHFEKSTRPEVKEFAATLAKSYKVDTGLAGQPAPAGSPLIHIFQLDTPSKTFSYNPVKIIYTVLHNDGKEGGITRAEADEIYNKLKEAYERILPWPLVKTS